MTRSDSYTTLTDATRPAEPMGAALRRQLLGGASGVSCELSEVLAIGASSRVDRFGKVPLYLPVVPGIVAGNANLINPIQRTWPIRRHLHPSLHVLAEGAILLDRD